ncbi:MAG: hypothetical protein EHM59_05540 [Betaproteobacteria bacterium]|nr:MAG: hypothetical protein EHM59_05540 [Betaproteobacteria bacterium]
MKQYMIVPRKSQWHMLVDGQEPGLIRHDSREFVISMAAALAALHDDSIAVYSESGQLAFATQFRSGLAVPADGMSNTFQERAP